MSEHIKNCICHDCLPGSDQLLTVHGWTLIRGKRDLNRFDKENHISYRSEPSKYPCLARSELSSDENPQTMILEKHELADMLNALTTP